MAQLANIFQRLGLHRDATKPNLKVNYVVYPNGVDAIDSTIIDTQHSPEVATRTSRVCSQIIAKLNSEPHTFDSRYRHKDLELFVISPGIDITDYDEEIEEALQGYYDEIELQKRVPISIEPMTSLEDLVPDLFAKDGGQRLCIILKNKKHHGLPSHREIGLHGDFLPRSSLVQGITNMLIDRNVCVLKGARGSGERYLLRLVAQNLVAKLPDIKLVMIKSTRRNLKHESFPSFEDWLVDEMHQRHYASVKREHLGRNSTANLVFIMPNAHSSYKDKRLWKYITHQSNRKCGPRFLLSTTFGPDAEYHRVGTNDSHPENDVDQYNVPFLLDPDLFITGIARQTRYSDEPLGLMLSREAAAELRDLLERSVGNKELHESREPAYYTIWNAVMEAIYEITLGHMGSIIELLAALKEKRFLPIEPNVRLSTFGHILANNDNLTDRLVHLHSRDNFAVPTKEDMGFEYGTHESWYTDHDQTDKETMDMSVLRCMIDVIADGYIDHDGPLDEIPGLARSYMKGWLQTCTAPSGKRRFYIPTPLHMLAIESYIAQVLPSQTPCYPHHDPKSLEDFVRQDGLRRFSISQYANTESGPGEHRREMGTPYHVELFRNLFIPPEKNGIPGGCGWTCTWLNADWSKPTTGPKMRPDFFVPRDNQVIDVVVPGGDPDEFMYRIERFGTEGTYRDWLITNRVFFSQSERSRSGFLVVNFTDRETFEGLSARFSREELAKYPQVLHVVRVDEKGDKWKVYDHLLQDRSRWS
ncbi:hypothetical protein BJ508DRAFT_328656 [Ascobolus immersus RN42]|uniref:Uncharacterized protein n=1 Tax=Ascobolus immersus RN42 TaxID=1160509 RepID=A0A3N4I137_ASCIM|nr:hypothetical protein BJ508DRAFT_328656 [Ascobolus immersus RN42]